MYHKTRNKKSIISMDFLKISIRINLVHNLLIYVRITLIAWKCVQIVFKNSMISNFQVIIYGKREILAQDFKEQNASSLEGKFKWCNSIL